MGVTATKPYAFNEDKTRFDLGRLFIAVDYEASFKGPWSDGVTKGGGGRYIAVTANQAINEQNYIPIAAIVTSGHTSGNISFDVTCGFKEYKQSNVPKYILSTLISAHDTSISGGSSVEYAVFTIKVIWARRDVVKAASGS